MTHHLAMANQKPNSMERVPLVRTMLKDGSLSELRPPASAAGLLNLPLTLHQNATTESDHVHRAIQSRLGGVYVKCLPSLQFVHWGPPVEIWEPPAKWPEHGKYFPLGEKSEAKGDWRYFYRELALKKDVLIQGAIDPDPPQTELTAPETVQEIKDNLRTHVLATVHCPGWAQGWARSVLDLVVFHVSTTSILKLFAIKGGTACDEEIAFLFIMMKHLGFKIHLRKLGEGEKKWGLHRVIEWKLPRMGGDHVTPYNVVLQQYDDVEYMRNLDWEFAPVRGRWIPNAARYAVISCAENWYLRDEEHPQGESVRLNKKYADAKHPQGMTVNEKLNATLVQSLETAKELACTNGFKRYDCSPSSTSAGTSDAIKRESCGSVVTDFSSAGTGADVDSHSSCSDVTDSSPFGALPGAPSLDALKSANADYLGRAVPTFALQSSLFGNRL